jgi:hypothetical protein
MSDDAVPNGLGPTLAKLKMTYSEFIICAGFWFAMLIVSSFISINDILSTCASPHEWNPRPLGGLTPAPRARLTDITGIPPISIVISGVSMVMRSGLLTLGFQLAIVLAALYGLYKYREAVGKSMLFLVRKVTGKRR